jgi:hypothetical protein
VSGDDDSVIEELEARRGRARREPPPRRPARGAPTPPSVTDDSSAVSAIGDQRPKRSLQRRKTPASAGETASISKGSASLGEAAFPTQTAQAPGPVEEPLRLAADEPIVNYAVRVRRSLDDLVAWRLAELRRQGVRTTKVELTELLLWELSAAPAEDLARRLAEFRRHAPR